MKEIVQREIELGELAREERYDLVGRKGGYG